MSWDLPCLIPITRIFDRGKFLAVINYKDCPPFHNRGYVMKP